MGLKLRQETSDPANSVIKFAFDVKKPVSLTLRIRKPQWANKSVLKVSGKSQTAEVDEYGYFKITRLWKQADRIEIAFNPQVYTEAMPDNNKRVGVFMARFYWQAYWEKKNQIRLKAYRCWLQFKTMLING